MSENNNNLTWHDQSVSHTQRSAIKGHKGALLWFTGLSGAGKSTIANAVEMTLNERRIHSYLLDGDNVRLGLNNNLSFSAEDRTENVRRIGEVGKLLVDAGLIVCAAFISPYRTDRDRIRSIMPDHSFIEIHVDASLATCEARDPKDLYKKARRGEIKGFTGIDDVFEAPNSAEITLDADTRSVPELAAEVVTFLEQAGVIDP